MLGNFSFGDYFKEEIIPWSWDYLTNRLKIPSEKLRVSIHEKDDEAFGIWNKTVGLPESKISRLGDEHNFWMMAETGPCGPDSEIFYDLGAELGCGKPDCGPGCECERWPEVWNLVFTQFNRHADGTLETLPKKNVDTGMGMERLCMVLQNVNSVFETDLFAELLQFARSITNPDILKSNGFITRGVNSLYVFCDHLRASAFLLSDGLYPSNEGRGYVLRRVIRRCLIHLRKLNAQGPILTRALEPVLQKYGEIYPSLIDKREFISELLSMEEENFDKLIERNYGELEKVIKGSGEKLSGDEAFYFYDTLGVPIELAKDISLSLGKGIDEARFNELLEEQKSRARTATASHKAEDKYLHDLVKLPEGIKATEAVYYQYDKIDADVLYSDAGTGVLVLDKTPFYPEAGGQVGDNGVIVSDGRQMRVVNTQIMEGGIILHFVDDESKPMLDGLQGKRVTAAVISPHRQAIRRAHTCTHLLHAALRKVLGEHVTQSGSKVEEDEFRFDFTHFKPMTQDEIIRVSDIVNEWLLESLPVRISETSLSEAREKKAMALFEGKYDEKVRMIEIGREPDIISRELCGGLHMSDTSHAGLFIIKSETGIAAGVRRIIAVTGKKAYGELKDLRATFSRVCAMLDCENAGMIGALEKLVADYKDVSTELKQLKGERRGNEADDILSIGEYVDDIHVITAEVNDVSKDELRDIGDRIRKKASEKTAIFLTHSLKGNVSLLIMLTDDMVNMGYRAGELMAMVAPILGGKGGGKPAMAQGGGNLPAKVPDAFDAFMAAIAGGPA